jgi:hypothetical protein
MAAIKFCRNAKEIARLLLKSDKRKAVAEVCAWVKRAEFPSKAKAKSGKQKAERVMGWRVEDLVKWHEAFEKSFDNDQKLIELRKLNIRKSWAEGRRVSDEDKLYAGIVDEIGGQKAEGGKGGQHGEIQQAKQGGNGASGHQRPTLGRVDNFKMLAVALARHFAGRVSIDISAQQISKWKQGQLPEGVPPPPVRVGNDILVDQWAEWFERFMVPIYAMQPDMQGNLLPEGQLALLRRENEAEELAHAKWIRDKERGDFEKQVQEACAREFIGVIKNLHAAVVAENEQEMVKAAVEQLRNVGVDEVRIGQFREWFLSRQQEITKRQVERFRQAELSQTGGKTTNGHE